jgi:hypothetical protein
VESIGNAAEEGGLLSGVFTAAAKTQPSTEDTIEDFHIRQFEKIFPSTGQSSSPQGSFSYRAETTHISILPRIKDVLTPEEAEKCLAKYRSISPVYFPFVVLLNDWTLQSMLRHSPTLLLAILTTMCNSTHMQKTLDSGFREVVSQRVLVRGEKSLDILQGLIVYLAWHPFHLKPMNRQIHQFVQMAATMAMDMKLHVTPGGTAHSIEDKRAYLGCFYMSSVYVEFNASKHIADTRGSYAIAPTRKNPLDFGPYTEQVLADLYTYPQFRSDYNLVKMVRLQAIIDGCLKQYVADQRMTPELLEDGPLNDRISAWLVQIEAGTNQDLPMPNSEFFFSVCSHN